MYKTYFIKITLAILFYLALSSNLFAIPATPFPVKIQQPDGTEITIRIHGDEFFNYKTTTDGYLLIEGGDGIHRYAKISNLGRPESTGIKAHEIGRRTLKEKKELNELEKNPNLQKIALQNRASRIKSISTAPLSDRAYPLTGSPKSLVILVNFVDKNFVVPNPQIAFTNLLNEENYNINGGTGSARDYFRDASNGLFAPEFDVVGPYTLPQNTAYYGDNDSDDSDKNPRQMVIDACRLADQNGIDFTEYDTDNDGIVDNVFIYYAGYNEAEGGPKNTVWPHRWVLANSSTKFDGKTIIDYACTSELKGSRNANMCGIGTFCHEFGHVLGLPDYYITKDGPTHFTLNDWNIMDAGAYLNEERTPPTYSGYDRFFLDWLRPVELKGPQNVTLEPLLSSNKAFLITQNGNHNMNGANPSPLEFFILENRQKTGWDTYLPGKGMLVTRINYNAATWESNSPNNDPSSMGVDIMEADQLATSKSMSGDPFPGSGSKTTYNPLLRNGTNINKPITFIKEENGVISFRFMGGEKEPMTPPVANDATYITEGNFTANWNKVLKATGYYLTAYSLSEGNTLKTEGFRNGLAAPLGWTIYASSVTKSQSFSGDSLPAILFEKSGNYIETEVFLIPVDNMSVYLKSLEGKNGNLLIEGWNGSLWDTIDNVSVTTTLANTKKYSFDVENNYLQFKFSYQKGDGSLALDDVKIGFNKNVDIIYTDKWLTDTTDTVNFLVSGRKHYYKVKASDKNVLDKNSYENISNYSNLIETETLADKNPKKLKSMVLEDGNIQVVLLDKTENLYVYNSVGMLIRTVQPTQNVITLEGLPTGQMYILKAGKRRSKIILL